VRPRAGIEVREAFLSNGPSWFGSRQKPCLARLAFSLNKIWRDGIIASR
jgi:hypothetical protein